MGAREVHMKYRQIRYHLECARGLLDDNDEIDGHLALVLDHVAETVLRIEQLSEASGNVFKFPDRNLKSRIHGENKK
jgi:hypothetical protein